MSAAISSIHAPILSPHCILTVADTPVSVMTMVVCPPSGELVIGLIISPT